MNYYIEQDEEIKLWADNKAQLQNTILFMPQYAELEIKSTQKEIILYNGKYVFKRDVSNDLFRDAVTQKRQENEQKADEARYNQEFVVTLQNKECIFDTTDKTQKDLLTAFAICSTGETYDGWVTNNNITIDLTMDDLMVIYPEFKQRSNVYEKWSYFETQISNARTIADIEAIIIDYGVN